MDVSAAAVGVTNRTATERAGDSAASEAAQSLTADFDTFLKLLTTQMQNQDPLQPMESTEFVAQLAQFSAVEQQIAGNRTLETILATLGGSDVGALGSWLGREVRAPGGVVHDGGSVEVFPVDAPADATSAKLAVIDEAGFTVREIAFDPGAESVTWDGDRDSGDPAAAGPYRFEARYAEPGGETVIGAVESWGRVIEARHGETGADLTLAGGFTVEAGAVSALREG